MGYVVGGTKVNLPEDAATLNVGPNNMFWLIGPQFGA